MPGDTVRGRNVQDDALTSWQGPFGKEYADRNPVTSAAVNEASAVFGRMLDEAGVRTAIGSVVEIGANTGINLRGLRRLLPPTAVLAAVEPNTAACARLRADAELRAHDVLAADAYDIPLADASYDLVFTNGVLIHVPPARLGTAMREIARVARRYVLCSEYFAHDPTEIAYRGRMGMLWKRDFGRAYLEHCPELTVLRYGFIWQHEFPNFDDLNWWVFEKSTAAPR
jgi:pseudaminic acid biosynthesis-associated methylase